MQYCTWDVVVIARGRVACVCVYIYKTLAYRYMILLHTCVQTQVSFTHTSHLAEADLYEWVMSSHIWMSHVTQNLQDVYVCVSLLRIYIYIYIHMCVCVCACVCHIWMSHVTHKICGCVCVCVFSTICVCVFVWCVCVCVCACGMTHSYVVWHVPFIDVSFSSYRQVWLICKRDLCLAWLPCRRREKKKKKKEGGQWV